MSTTLPKRENYNMIQNTPEGNAYISAIKDHLVYKLQKYASKEINKQTKTIEMVNGEYKIVLKAIEFIRSGSFDKKIWTRWLPIILLPHSKFFDVFENSFLNYKWETIFNDEDSSEYWIKKYLNLKFNSFDFENRTNPQSNREYYISYISEPFAEPLLISFDEDPRLNAEYRLDTGHGDDDKPRHEITAKIGLAVKVNHADEMLPRLFQVFSHVSNCWRELSRRDLCPRPEPLPPPAQAREPEQPLGGITTIRPLGNRLR